VDLEEEVEVLAVPVSSPGGNVVCTSIGQDVQASSVLVGTTGHWDGGKQVALEELGMGIVSAAAVQKD
jgi:hypothetical protein